MSHRIGFSFFGAPALVAVHGHSWWWCMGLVAPQNVGSSLTRDQTHVPCIGRQTLNHWTTRGVLYFWLISVTVTVLYPFLYIISLIFILMVVTIIILFYFWDEETNLRWYYFLRAAIMKSTDWVACTMEMYFLPCFGVPHYGKVPRLSRWALCSFTLGVLARNVDTHRQLCPHAFLICLENLPVDTVPVTPHAGRSGCTWHAWVLKGNRAQSVSLPSCKK